MRFITTITAICFFYISFAQAQEIPDSLQTEIFFETTTHDFGEIIEGSKAEFEFQFTNKGNAPLVLSNVSSSCGCTVPDWTKKPVNPRKKSEIMVKYNTNSLGTFNKTVTVYSNAKNSPVKLIIKGNVVPSNTKPKNGNYSKSEN